MKATVVAVHLFIKHCRHYREQTGQLWRSIFSPHAAALTARQQILRRELHADCSIAMDT